METFALEMTAVTETLKSGANTVKNSAEYLGHNIVNLGKQGAGLASNAIDKLVTLAKTLWSQVQPMFEKTVSWVKTPAGLCGLSLAASCYALFKMVPAEKNPQKRVVLNVAAVCLAVLSGVIGAQAGFLKISVPMI